MTQAFWFDPALPFVESRRAQHSRACYRGHSHPALSIGAVDLGHSTLSVEGKAAIRLAAGDLVLIPPHLVHACNPDPDGAWSYQMLYLDADWVRALVGECRLPGARVDLGNQAGLCRAGAYQQFCRLNTGLFSPLEPEYKESLLIEFVGSVLTGGEPAVLPVEPLPAWLPRMQQMLARQCELRWPVEQLAEQAGLSRFYFIRAFHAHTGMTPHAFQLDCRINRARVLLRSGYPLAELAQMLGFSDQSHFHHAFKQRVAVTPRQYLGRLSV
jgi:AraC-like DNA-binding protein